jgi:AcrR family transcriptional regulator
MARRTAPRPRKRPSQARSQATVDAILDAAARVLVTGGYGAFTTNRVADRAGVSVGSLYQYFPNKEALLAELKSRHVADIERHLEAALARLGDAPLPEIVAAVIEANVAAHLLDPALHRVLSEEVPQLGPTDATLAFERRAAVRVRALLERHRRTLAIADLDLTTFVVMRVVEATIHDAVAERPADLASGAVAREVTRLLLGYLGTNGRPRISSPAPPGRAARPARAGSPRRTATLRPARS